MVWKKIKTKKTYKTWLLFTKSLILALITKKCSVSIIANVMFLNVNSCFRFIFFLFEKHYWRRGWIFTFKKHWTGSHWLSLTATPPCSVRSAQCSGFGRFVTSFDILDDTRSVFFPFGENLELQMKIFPFQNLKKIERKSNRWVEKRNLFRACASAVDWHEKSSFYNEKTSKNRISGRNC